VKFVFKLLKVPPIEEHHPERLRPPPKIVVIQNPKPEDADEATIARWLHYADFVLRNRLGSKVG
jgi:hypothetical protein